MCSPASLARKAEGTVNPLLSKYTWRVKVRAQPVLWAWGTEAGAGTQQGPETGIGMTEACWCCSWWTSNLLKDKYVILEDADFEEAMPEKNKMINLQTFVKLQEIDSIYFDTPYYLEPQKSGEKAYQLLLQALEKSKMAGLGTFVMRSVENLAIIKPYKNILLLNKLRFEEEIRDTDELKTPSIKISKQEMDMALQLIKMNSKEFDISAFKNEYSKELMKIINQKSKGKRATIRKINVENTKATDLLEKLKASLA